mmetsp:Transcript_8067/g.20762  ORF Transcript_8067/g.20762 Transcript_8067/m.20762 type:complete len:640 (+) Transcript_8067:207-2126(+)
MTQQPMHMSPPQPPDSTPPPAAAGVLAPLPPPSAAGGAGSGGMPSPPLFCEVYSDVASMFEVGRKLGQGNFAKVVQASARRDLPSAGLRAGEQVAVKIVKKPSAMAAPVVEMLRSEIAILRSVRHPNIVRLHDVLETPGKLYLVLQLCAGGELFDRIVSMGRYSEEDARYFTFKLLNAVLYLHDSSICHRDLKPENILLSSADDEAELLITDFGLGKVVQQAGDGVSWREVALRTRCGTPGYAAPEVISSAYGASADRRYGLACDMWSVGVIVYILLSACPPFAARDDEEMQRQVCSPGALQFPPKHWASISAEAVDLIRGLLVVDPSKRLTALEALQHPWVVSVGVHNTDLFHAEPSSSFAAAHTAAAAPAAAAPALRQRFGEFNTLRRAGDGLDGDDADGADVAEPLIGHGLSAESQAASFSVTAAQLGLPAEETLLRLFRCACDGRLGQLVVTSAHVGFAATDGASLWVRPLGQLVHVNTARYIESNAATDNSLILSFVDGSTTQLDGFWQRDACLQLIRRVSAAQHVTTSAHRPPPPPRRASPAPDGSGGHPHPHPAHPDISPPLSGRRALRNQGEPPPPAAGAVAARAAATPPNAARAAVRHAGAVHPPGDAASSSRRLAPDGRPLRLTRSSVD